MLQLVQDMSILRYSDSLAYDCSMATNHKVDSKKSRMSCRLIVTAAHTQQDLQQAANALRQAAKLLSSP